MVGIAAKILLMLLLVAFSVFLAGGKATAETFTIVYDTAEDFEQLLRDSNIDATSEPGTIRLYDQVLLADEMGNAYVSDVGREIISGDVKVKKEFLLDSADVWGATLVVCTGRGAAPLTAELNGHPVVGEFSEPQDYWQMGWSTLELPVEFLRDGLNEVVLSAKPGASFGLMIEDCVWPNRSAKSVDGGKTWDYDHLGDGNFHNGEYLVRLRLHRYAPKGVVWSPPIDLAELASGWLIGARIKKGEGKVGFDFEGKGGMPEGAGFELAVRFGTTPSYDPKTWESWQTMMRDWRPAEPPSDGVERPRYMQWRLTLTTDNAKATLVVDKITLKIDAGVEPSPDAEKIKITRWENEEIVRTSYNFAYQKPGGRAGLLRSKWKLDDVIAPAKSEFEKFILLRNWVRAQWEDGWNIGSLSMVPRWDAPLVLTLAGRNESLGMCTHYANVFTQCCVAVGLQARTFIRGHCINEIWSNEYKKWIVTDMSGDTDDELRRTLHYERDGVPLSGLELHRAKLAGETESIKIAPESSASLYGEGKGLGFERFFLPLRNNHLDSIEPEEPEHGQGYFKFTGHIWWRDEQTEPLPWTNLYTEREGDLYWTLNQAELHLQYGEEPGAIFVQIDTVTPNFKTFLVKIDDGEWKESPASFIWTLHEGINSLQAKPVNAFGLEGITSKIALEYQPGA